MIGVPDILQIHLLAIHHHVLHPTSIVVNLEVLLSIDYAIQPKRDIDDALIRVALHQAQNQSIGDVLDIVKIAYAVSYQFFTL